eukprot:4102618-Prymnesium_polylepis.1
MSYKRLQGPTTEDEMLVKHIGSQVVTTLANVREKASSSFPMGNGHGWQVFVGVDVKSLRFVADQQAWVARFEVVHAADALKSTHIYVREVSSIEKQSTLLAVRPTAVTADLTLDTTPIELRQAAKVAARARAKQPNSSRLRSKGSKGPKSGKAS